MNLTSPEGIKDSHGLPEWPALTTICQHPEEWEDRPLQIKIVKPRDSDATDEPKRSMNATPPLTAPEPRIDHFLRLADRGTDAPGTASTGERAAAKLAQQLPDLTWIMMDIDRNARAGMLELVALLCNPNTREQALDTLP
jgi:hypothetical protein